MPINLSTRELRAFVALAEQRNFTRAAAQCHLSQPAFSALISGLERGLGARLFHRTTRHVDLTAEGAAFLGAAENLLRDAEAAAEDVRDHVARRRGRVSVAVLPSLAAGWLPPLLAAFHRDQPPNELEVADVLSEQCNDRVRNGQADFALASTRLDAPELRTEAFCTDDFHVVFPAGHALDRSTRAVPLTALASFPFIQLARSSSVRQYLDAAVYPARLRTLLELEQLSTVAGMVVQGLGITVVPALTPFHFQNECLRTRRVRADGLTRQVFLVRRADRALSSAAQAFYEQVLLHRPR